MSHKGKNEDWVSAVIIEDDSNDESEEVIEITPVSQKNMKKKPKNVV